MALFFVTSNADKVHEISVLIPGVNQLNLELDEIQSLDPQVVIEHKLNQVAASHNGAFIVDDTSLVLSCLGSLPGPLMKWFIQGMGLSGITKLAARYDDKTAIARTTLGYQDERGSKYYFVGETSGRIAPTPRGKLGHGWDPIFIPDGYDQTFGELGGQVKNRMSMRAIAAKKLALHIDNDT